MSIVYISGGMAGYDGLNEPAFRAAAQTILDRGDAPLVPHDIKPHRHPGRECAPVYGAEKVPNLKSGKKWTAKAAKGRTSITVAWIISGDGKPTAWYYKHTKTNVAQRFLGSNR